MDLSQIRELLSVVADSDVEELTVEEEGLKITVRKSTPSLTMQPSGGNYPMPAPAPYPPQGYAAYPPQGYAPPQNAQQGAPQGAAPSGGPGQTGAPPAPPQEGSASPSAGDGAAAASPGEQEEAAAKGGTSVPAPIVGTFYRCPSPDDPPYVEVGDTVKEGDVLCIIEAMKLMNEIESEVSGTVREILVEDAEPVEYEQPLFVIEEA